LGSWAGLDDINSRSIGIEIVNVGLTEDGKREPFPNAQIDAVIKLCKDIQTRYNISPRNIVGHSDVAPARKQDPGEAFPWRTLAESGVGIWTDEFVESDDDLAKVLSDIGYDVNDLEKAKVAFQRHFYPQGLNGCDGMTLKRAVAVRRRLREDMD
jgi:N-acetylmuramoyl-L-alanine amidase